MAEPSRTTRWIAAVPNLLSVLRLGLAAAFPIIPYEQQYWHWRVVVVAAAGFSDWLDGFVARRWGVKSPSGVLLDATADKLFVFSVVLTLTLTGALQWWQMLLVIARDLAVGFVAAYVAGKRDWPAFRRLQPRLAGRLTTGFQFALFLAVLIWPETTFTTVVLGLTVFCSVLAALDYLGQFARALREDKAGH
ncbi:MAG: CDP-alcohol phosphatidyltransferase family protein [Planctomycetota bacterium]